MKNDKASRLNRIRIFENSGLPFRLPCPQQTIPFLSNSSRDYTTRKSTFGIKILPCYTHIFDNDLLLVGILHSYIILLSTLHIH